MPLARLCTSTVHFICEYMTCAACAMLTASALLLHPLSLAHMVRVLLLLLLANVQYRHSLIVTTTA
jgi:hypothetical protein